MDKLTKIYGIGPALAKDLVKDYNLDLDKPIRRQLKRKSVYPHLPEATKADLKYNPSRKIPRGIIHQVEMELNKYWKGTRFDVAGSYRRKKPTSRDVDIVICIPETKTSTQFWDALQLKLRGSRSLIFSKPYASGPDKISVIMGFHGKATVRGVTKKYKVNIKLDLFFTHSNEYMFTLLYGTGSGNFNMIMRAQAKRKGYLLNQRGLFIVVDKAGDILKRVRIRNEKDLFKKLNMKYKLPEDRH